MTVFEGKFNNSVFCCYNIDCYELLDLLITMKRKFRLIICDLPYKKTKNKWDSLLNLTLLWEKMLLLLEEKGTILFFSMQLFTSEIIESKKELYRYEVIWIKEKPTQIFEAKKRLLPIHENIEIFSTHENIEIFSLEYENLYHTIMIEGKKPYIKKKNISKQGTNYNKDTKEVTTISKGERFPTTVIYCPRDFQNRGIHPTQKPVLLLRKLIQSYSNQDDWILDYCAGGFSSLIASLLEERNCIAGEKDENMFNLAKQRISQFLLTKEDTFKKPKVKSKNEKIEKKDINLDKFFKST